LYRPNCPRYFPDYNSTHDTLANLTDTHLRRSLFNFLGGSSKNERLKIELNAKNCDLIPCFQNINKHSMSDIKKLSLTENCANHEKSLSKWLP
jgi:hypothetical protein